MRRDRSGKAGGRRKRLVRFLLMAPFLLWVLANLFFATSWGTGLLTGKVESRYGIQSTIDRISWTPWSGVTVSKLRVEPPKDLEFPGEILTVESIQIDPSWLSLVQGKKRFEKVQVKGVRGEVSLELLKAVMARGQLPVQADPPTPPKEVRPEVESPGPLVVKKTKEASEELPSSKSQTASKSEVVEDAPAPIDDFEGTFVFEDVNLRLYSEQFPRVSVALSGVRGELPLWGDGREGRLEVGELELGEGHLVEGIEIPVGLKGRFLRVDDFPMKVVGLDLKLTAALWIAPGMPFGVQVELPAQQMDLTPLYPGGDPPFTVGELKSSGQIKGYLLNPKQVSGGSYTEIRDLKLRDQKDGSHRSFDFGRAHFEVSPSGLKSQDFRILGDEEALLGNGYATVGGDVAVVVRMVANPTRADSLEKRVSQVSDQLDLKFAPLVTPDREYRDVHLELRSGTLMMDLGHEEAWVPFFPVIGEVMGRSRSQTTVFP